jgi:hypothetical protein
VRRILELILRSERLKRWPRKAMDDEFSRLERFSNSGLFL